MGFKVDHICDDWGNMLDFPFIPGLPKYYLADFCARCKVWYPKHKVGKFCPCCRQHIRFKPLTFSLDKTMFPVYDKMIEAYKIEHPGWTLIRQEVYKHIIDYEILVGNV